MERVLRKCNNELTIDLNFTQCKGVMNGLLYNDKLGTQFSDACHTDLLLNAAPIMTITQLIDSPRTRGIADVDLKPGQFTLHGCSYR